MRVNIVGGPADGKSLVVDERVNIEDGAVLFWTPAFEAVGTDGPEAHTYLFGGNCAIYLGKKPRDGDLRK